MQKDILLQNFIGFANSIISNALARINKIQVGTIQSFDSSTQRASIQISAQRPVSQDILNNITWDTYTLLIEVPIIIIGGGSSHISFPIQAGDECIVLFNDTDITNWKLLGGSQQLDTYRSHDLSDGFALVGLRNFTRSLANFDISNIDINGNVNVSTGVSGKCTTLDGSILTFTNGILTNIQ